MNPEPVRTTQHAAAEVREGRPAASRGMGGHQSAHMMSDTWLTPPDIIKRVGPFDLDPETGRRPIGIEIDERYCDAAARRLSQQPLPLNAHEIVASRAP